MNFAWLIVAGLGLFWLLKNAATEMCQEEIRTRLARLPNTLIRLAAARLPRETRADLADEWHAELASVLQDTDGLPLTRLLRGTQYAVGLLWAAGRVARELSGAEEGATSANAATTELLLDAAVDAFSHLDSVGYCGPTACAAAGISYRQLDYWARTGLVEPSLRPGPEAGPARLYSFRDIVLLAMVKRLLDSGISIQQIRAAVTHLRSRGVVTDLAQVTLMSDGESVYECTSPDEVVDLLAGCRDMFGLALGQLWKEVRRSLSVLPPINVTTGQIMDTSHHDQPESDEKG